MQIRKKRAYGVFVQLVPDLHPRKRSLVSHECTLVSQDLHIAALNQKRGQSFEIPEEWARVWMRKVFLHMLAQVTRDRIQVVTRHGLGYNIELRIAFPRVAAHGEI